MAQTFANIFEFPPPRIGLGYWCPEWMEFDLERSSKKPQVFVTEVCDSLVTKELGCNPSYAMAHEVYLSHS